LGGRPILHEWESIPGPQSAVESRQELRDSKPGGKNRSLAVEQKQQRKITITGQRTKQEKNSGPARACKGKRDRRPGARTEKSTWKELQQRKTYDRNELNQLRIYELWRRKNQQTVTLCAARTETKPQSLERDHDGLTSSGELTGRTPEKIGEHRTQVAPAPKA
jgi:hypothetical protein